MITTSDPPLEMMLELAIADHEARLRISLLLERIRAYAAAAPTQNDRIWHAQTMAQESFMTPNGMQESTSWFRQCRVEAHFYLMCWDAVAKCLEALRSNRVGLRSPTSVWKRHRQTLQSYQIARDNIEHWTERLPGGSQDMWNRSSDDRGSMIAGNPGVVKLERVFSFQGTTWDIGPSSAALLVNICGELERELRAELSLRYQAVSAAPSLDET